MPGDRERCLADRVSAYFARPVGIRTLMTTIADLRAGSTIGPSGEEVPG